MGKQSLIWVLLLLPVLGSAMCVFLPAPGVILLAVSALVLLLAFLAGITAWQVIANGPIMTAGEWFSVDALSAYHLVVMMMIFAGSSLYAIIYFREESLTLKQARRYGSLWCGSLAAMTLVLISNNLGIMWVGIEATTLLTAFLICIPLSPLALEAMWKYLLMCSVGVAFAFTGTLLMGAATMKTLGEDKALLWTSIMGVAQSLDPNLVKVAFIFLLVGYGTKVGLAPIHNWLPDAHSQAPAPVSAIFSGFLLNCALYCIMRYIPITESALNHQGWSLRLLVFFGLLSILIAAVFIVAQHDVKRLLAYHSVEHLGIITLGLGLGGMGVFAALFHTLNHSVCKALAFYCAGRLGQLYHTHDMRHIQGMLRASPIWGSGLLGSILALIGLAPFALFMSEFQIFKAAADSNSIVALVIFLLGAGVVFVGALKHGISMSWGDPSPQVKPENTHWLDVILVAVPLAILLFLGLWMPDFLRISLTQAMEIIRR